MKDCFQVCCWSADPCPYVCWELLGYLRLASRFQPLGGFYLQSGVLWPLSYHRRPGMWVLCVTCWPPRCAQRQEFRQCLSVRTTICSLWAVYSASSYLWSCEALFVSDTIKISGLCMWRHCFFLYLFVFRPRAVGVLGLACPLKCLWCLPGG